MYMCVCVCVGGGGGGGGGGAVRGSEACLYCSTKRRIRIPIYLFVGFLVILQVELQASTR